MNNPNDRKKQNRTPLRALALVVTAWALLAGASFSAARTLYQSAEEGAQLFEQYCKACHTIGGGDLVGPDLQGVTDRRDLAWLKRFIQAPDQAIASGDPIVTELLAKYNNIPMPNLGLAPAQVDSLIAYLSSPTAGGGAGAAAEPLSGGDPQSGKRLFQGAQQLTNGGTACIACHNVQDIAALGGGTLAPDLTQVFSRYGDVGLSSALRGLPFPTMQGIFMTKPLTAKEQADLYAFFQQADALPAQTTDPHGNWFWGIGGLGALVLFGVMLVFWPRQRTSISKSLRETKV